MQNNDSLCRYLAPSWERLLHHTSDPSPTIFPEPAPRGLMARPTRASCHGPVEHHSTHDFGCP